MWNKIYFLQQAKQVYGNNFNKFNFSKITDKDIINSKSKINIICNVCKHEWSPQIYNFLHRGKGCPHSDCGGRIKWSLTKFLEKAKKIHGKDTYDYSKNTNENINNQTRMIIICNKCKHEWSPVLYSHINKKSKCPNCENRLKWDLKRFLEKAIKIHKDKFNYSQIKESDIKDCYSKVKIICKKNNHEWYPSINSHIYNKSGCPHCHKEENYWNLEKFIEKAEQIHGINVYDYSKITKENIINMYSRLFITCKKCNHEWITSIDSHIYGKSGCPTCASSKLEKTALYCLEKLSIENIRAEYIPDDFKTINCSFRFDFCFVINDISYFIELDGIQHFESVKLFDKKSTLEHRQLKDRFKTQYVINHPYNYRLIRIDYTCKIQKDMEIFIQKSIDIGEKLCLFNNELYKNWLLKPIEETEYKQLSKSNLIFQHEFLLTSFKMLNKMKEEVRKGVKKHFNVK